MFAEVRPSTSLAGEICSIIFLLSRCWEGELQQYPVHRRVGVEPSISVTSSSSLA